MLPPLRLCASDFRTLLAQQGLSVGLWRAAEIAALREQVYEHPILDMGCGDGLVSSLVLSHIEVGLDPNWPIVARAYKRGIYAKMEPRAVEKSHLPSASIETIFSNAVLEHIVHVDTALSAVARLLRPGGRLIFTAPTAAFSTWLTLPGSRYATWRNRQLEYRNLWSAEEWDQHLAMVGLRVEWVRPYLRRKLVWLWDALELLQQMWFTPQRMTGIVRRRIAPAMLESLGQWAANVDLAAPKPGGGHLIVARKC